MEVLNDESKPIDGSSQPVEIPQSVSTHAAGAWPKFNMQQTTNYESDITKQQHNIGGVDLVTWREDGVRTWEPTYSDVYSSPDAQVRVIFDVINKLSKVLVDPKSMVVDRHGITNKIKQFNLDMFTPPPTDAPAWKHRNYERLLEEVVAFTGRQEHLPMPPNGATLVDWGGPMDRPFLSSFIADRLAEGEHAEFNGAAYATGSSIIGAVSRSMLGNRLDTALVIDTPRKTLAAWRFFNLIHGGYPWYNAHNQFADHWNNFRTPLQVRSSFEVFNSYVSRVPSYSQSLKSSSDTYAEQSLGPLSDDLTYDPPMYDIGSTILNVATDVSNHVSAMMRSTIKMESISYMETSSLLMQMSTISANKASSLSSFTATINNSAASQAFEPVVNSLACAFTKIALDIPSNARQATVMMVVTLMTYPSCIYDNHTKALIHNMFVGMVMPTNVGAYPGAAAKESTIDFTQIRKLAGEFKLMPTPIPVANNANPEVPQRTYASAHIVRDAMIRLLAHFHGLEYSADEDGFPTPVSIANALWTPTMKAGANGGYGANPDAKDLYNPTYTQHYYNKWGTIPNPEITPDTYLHGLISSDPARGPSLSKTIIASSFDHQIRDGEFPAVGVRPAEGMKYDGCNSWAGCMSHGMRIKVDGKYVNKGHAYAVCRLEKDEVLGQGFTDDVREVTETHIDISERNDVKLVDEKYFDEHAGVKSVFARKEYVFFLIPEKDVIIHKNASANLLNKLRPRLTSILPIRGMSIEKGAMTESLKRFISDVIQPILEGVTTVGEQKYVNHLATLTFNQRWATFMDYITEAATATMLTDYSPFGFTPLIYSVSENVNMRDPHSMRNNGSMGSDNCPLIAHPAAAGRPKFIGVFEDPEGETNPDQGYWRYEPEPLHRTVMLEPSNLVALALLGVAPSTPPDLTGSISLCLDAKAFNHDVSIMKCSARMFMDVYSQDVHQSMGRFDAQTPVYKISKYRDILKQARTMFPTVSALTSAVDKSMDQYDLRQNQFWKSSPMIDAEFDRTFVSLYDVMGGYQFPFLRHRPITPMCNKNSRGQDIIGYQDSLFYQVMTVCQPYTEHILSLSDRVTDIVYVPDTRIITNYARTRDYQAGAVPLPSGAPYISPLYHDSPMVESRWLYSLADAGVLHGEYDVYKAIAGGLGVPGVSPSRHHSMVYSDWKYARRLATGLTQLRHRIFNPHGVRISFDPVGALLDNDHKIETPDVEDHEYPTTQIKVTFTTPSMYVGKPQDIMDMSGVPSGVLPVLRKNQGPFISRFAKRSASWPANADFTIAGSLTENIVSDTPAGRGKPSCEFNSEMIGVVPARSKPINMVDPTNMLVLVKDPLATWYKL